MGAPAAAQPSPWIPLAQAAEQVRAAQRDSDLDRMSRGLSETEHSLLGFWARQVARLGVPVYGSRIASTKRERVPEAAFLRGKLQDGVARLETTPGDPINDYCDLQVRRSDLDGCLARLGAANAGKPAV
jgi:hypothetical protein